MPLSPCDALRRRLREIYECVEEARVREAEEEAQALLLLVQQFREAIDVLSELEQSQTIRAGHAPSSWNSKEKNMDEKKNTPGVSPEPTGESTPPIATVSAADPATPTTPTQEKSTESLPQASTAPQVTPPIAQPPAKRDPFAVFNPVRARVVALMNEEWFQREASFAMQIINGNDALQTTDMKSRVQCLLNLANTGLTLNPVQRLAYLVPRKGKCLLEPSYMGLIKAVTDSGSVKVIRAEIVYAGDLVEIEKGTTVRVHHVPYWKAGNAAGDVIAAYSVAVLHDGTVDVLDMGRDVLDKIKAANESVKKGKFSPYTDWENEMFRKAPIRRHVKTLPRTERMERLMHAIALDDQQFGSTTAQVHGQSSEQVELRNLQLRLAEALDNYEGEDRETLRAQIFAKVQAKEFTLEYGNRMLAEITGQGGEE